MTAEHEGKWCASNHEEHWTDSQVFNTREDALRYALSELVDGHEHVWTGQIRNVTARECADAAVNGWEMVDAIGSYLYDNVHEDGPYYVDGIDEKELARVARDAIARYLTETNSVPKLWHVDHVNRHQTTTVESK